MRNALIGALCTVLLLIITTCSQRIIDTPDKYKLMVPPVPVPITNVSIEETEKLVALSETPEYISIDVMAKEIAEVWELFFDDGKAPYNDPRREMFDIYALEIAQAIDYWKKHKVDIGGSMPDHRSTHIIVAIVITRESSVNPNVVGKKFGEVSMFQLHGKALNGYSKEEVKRDTKLAAMLGVRWIAHSTSQCKNNRSSWDNKEWKNSDWLRPLTIYGSGPKKVYKSKKHRTCKVFRFAKRRTAEISMYQERIDNGELI